MEKTGQELMAQSTSFRRLDALVQPIMRAADAYADKRTSETRAILKDEIQRTLENVIEQWQDALRISRDLP